MRVLALIVASCCIAGAQPTFRSGVELVTIDVVATDQAGRPVHNLKADDFELFEDGKSQPVRTFQFIDASVASTEIILPPGIVSNDIEPGGIFAVVVDEIGLQPEDIRQVRRTTEDFFRNILQPHDHVAFIRSGAASGFFLSTDRELALKGVAQASGRRERTLGLEEPGGTNPNVVEVEPTIETFGTGENGRNSFRVLLGVVERLRQIQARRKAIVWFSRGGDMPPNILDSMTYGRPIGRDDDVFSKLIDTARAANVAIYTVDPRGQQTPGADVSRDIEAFDTGVVRDLASATGGRAVLSNDPEGGLKKVAAENRAYYLLGYEPPPGRDRDRPRKITVRTRAPGVSVLHRKVYVPSAAANTAPRSLLETPMPVRDLPIVLAPAAVAIDKKKRGVLLPFEIGRDLRDDTVVAFSAIALDPSGKVVARASNQGRSVNGRLAGDIGLTVGDADTYEVRFAAQAQDPEIQGLAFATVTVPKPRAKTPSCAGFVFEQQGQRPGMRAFVSERPLTISTLVSADKLSGALSFGLGAAGGVPQRLWPVAPGQPIENGLWRVALTLDAPLPTGNLEVRLMRDDLLLADGCIAQFASR